MNWGKGIALVLVIFVLGLAFLVYKTTEVTSKMVTDNYYEKELAYEDIIEGKKNINSLQNKIKITVNTNSVSVQFPTDLEEKEIKGNILFYRPDDPNKDRSTSIKTSNFIQTVDIKNFSTGNYQVQITFDVKEKKYYFEQNLFIP